MIPKIYLDNEFDIIKNVNKDDLIAVRKDNYDTFDVYVANDTIDNQVFSNVVKENKVDYLFSDCVNKKIFKDTNPTINDNYFLPTKKWINYITGEEFELQNYEYMGKCVWLGNKETTIMAIPPKNQVDVLNNESGLALYPFEGNAGDLSGKYNGKIVGTISWGIGKEGKCIISSWDSQVQIDNLPFTKDTPYVSVAFWFKWNGNNYVMPCGFYRYDLYIVYNYLGFNTAAADVYGIEFTQYKNKWVYVIATFYKNNIGKIWINGEPQTLKRISGNFNSYNAVFGSKFAIYGWRSTSGYRNAGEIDDFRILSIDLTDDQAKFLYDVANS